MSRTKKTLSICVCMYVYVYVCVLYIIYKISTQGDWAMVHTVLPLLHLLQEIMLLGPCVALPLGRCVGGRPGLPWGGAAVREVRERRPKGDKKNIYEEKAKREVMWWFESLFCLSGM